MKKHKNKKYHYFYKITNNINDHFYYGIHSTDNLNDDYMGSGVRLRHAYKKYGIENFSKEILKFFDSREAAADYELEIVTEELVRDENCYNLIIGGERFTTLGTATVKDDYGNAYQLPKDDPRILSGELKGITTGYGVYLDDEGNTYQLKIDDPRVLSGELKGITTGYGVYLDDEGNTYQLKIDDPRVLSGELKGITTGKVAVKDKSNNIFFVNIDDPRILSKKLTYIWEGRKHREETKEKQKRIFKEINHQQGSKNSQYGTCWITKDGANKKIKKEDLNHFKEQGWVKGRICK